MCMQWTKMQNVALYPDAVYKLYHDAVYKLYRDAVYKFKEEKITFSVLLVRCDSCVCSWDDGTMSDDLNH